MQNLKTLAMVCAIICTLGCGEEAPEEVSPSALCQGDFDAFELGISKSVGDFEVTLENANPAPPVEGFNRWTISISEMGVVREDLSPTFKPWMPEHGHGANIPVTSTFSEGTYASQDLDFFMPGRWETTVAFDDEEVIFAFCIN